MVVAQRGRRWSAASWRRGAVHGGGPTNSWKKGDGSARDRSGVILGVSSEGRGKEEAGRA
jgi:hypothetical protein